MAFKIAVNQEITFAITHTKLYIPVLTLSMIVQNYILYNF